MTHPKPKKVRKCLLAAIFDGNITAIQCRQYYHHSVNSSSHSVNGDIAIQWEWSNIDPSQNQNSLTDYDKTAQLITSTSRTRNPKFVPIDTKGASGQIREI